MNWSHVDYLWIVVMLLCTFGLMTPIQAPLVSDLKPFFFYKYVMIKKQLIYILDGLRVSTFSANFRFKVNYSFKSGV